MKIALRPEQEILRQRAHALLSDLRDLLAEAGASKADRTALADSQRQLDELFLLVVAGEFNAGKSSFINALLGQKSLLREGVTPTTSQIYLLQYGEEIHQEPRGPGIWVQTAPVPLLKTINIVDTPGTNAILREHEALTTDFIPRSDLVLFLTSSDRPFSESERSFLSRIREWGKKIVLVVNKMDLIEDEEERTAVLQFVTQSAHNLIGEIGAIFPVSARLAMKAKLGEPEMWPKSGFAALESYIADTLDEGGRFQLKLLNPLGVAHKLLSQQTHSIEAEWSQLSVDQQLLTDIDDQMGLYDQDLRRNFAARLSELDNLLFQMEQRGNEFFDDTIRIGRIPDLLKKEYLKEGFERVVVADTPQQIERRVGELVDWLVEQDLRQWSAVSDHLARRRQEVNERLVGQAGPREGTLAYDRQRLVDSIGKTAQHTIEGYDRQLEAERLSNLAREAVAGIAAGGAGVGLGAALFFMATVPWLDVTGVITGLGAATIGLFIFPNRRQRAKQDLGRRLEEMRVELLANLKDQFEREMRRGQQRVEDTVAPFSRFVRAEQGKIEGRRTQLLALEEELRQLKGAVSGDK